MGDNAAARLKKEGVDVAKTDVLTVSVHDIFFPPRTGHALSGVWHPRSELTDEDPGIRKLVESIVELGEIVEPGLVREDWTRDANGTKRKVFTCVDCSGRTIAGRYAEKILQKKGRCPKGMRIKVRLFVGDDRALLIARQRADSDPTKRPHAPSVLAVEVQQLRALAPDTYVTDLLPVVPRHVSKTDLERLHEWPNLHADCAAMIDAGAAPFGLFRALLEHPREEQSAALRMYLDNGVTHVKGATLVRNREAKKHAAATRTRPNEGDLPPPLRPSAQAAEVVTRRPHPKTMRRVADALSASSSDPYIMGAIAALRYAIGDEMTGKMRPVLASAIKEVSK